MKVVLIYSVLLGMNNVSSGIYEARSVEECRAVEATIRKVNSFARVASVCLIVRKEDEPQAAAKQ